MADLPRAGIVREVPSTAAVSFGCRCVFTTTRYPQIRGDAAKGITRGGGGQLGEVSFGNEGGFVDLTPRGVSPVLVLVGVGTARCSLPPERK